MDINEAIERLETLRCKIENVALFDEDLISLRESISALKVVRDNRLKEYVESWEIPMSYIKTG